MIWPYMDASGFQRAFAAADEDRSGAVEMEEFDEVVKFTVWLNENRHTIQELEDAFGETVGEDEFCFGYKTLFDVHAYGGACPPSRPLRAAVSRLSVHVCCLVFVSFQRPPSASRFALAPLAPACLSSRNHPLSAACGVTAGDAKYLYETHCKKLGREPEGEPLSFEEYVIWAVVHACITSNQEESEAEAQARREAVMKTELAAAAGEFGDVVSVATFALARDRRLWSR
eukprot:COSAG04_NODE_644_length_11643_cov_11.736983_8_plen_229_part_00